MPTIVLSTLNARYIHSSLGLRYLMANMGELEAETCLQEFNLSARPIDICESLLRSNPKIIGFGIYIWNIEKTSQVIKLIKTIRPDIHIIIGGPEVSYEYDDTEVFQHCDLLITGQADLEFARICRTLLKGHRFTDKVIHAERPALQDIALPYRYYNSEDINNRIIYVEASRGCPFKCEFCISSLDKTAWPFDLALFLQNMQSLYERGVRHFKFVDRTFNLKVESSIRIMQFFLDRMTETPLFLHFELIPDHLPEQLKHLIMRFPATSLQFEIGIQSLEPSVQTLISRKQNNQRAIANLKWIRQQTQAHIHADLIIGLPGEDMQTFAQGFDRLVALQPHEIQVGILKRLKGTPILRHTRAYAMRYNPDPPYNILCNDLIDFDTMQRLTRFSRYWDLIANSGRFHHALELMLGAAPFDNFMLLSDWIYTQTGQTHKIALERLFRLLYLALQEALGLDKELVTKNLLMDYDCSGIKGSARFLTATNQGPQYRPGKPAQRQQHHLN